MSEVLIAEIISDLFSLNESHALSMQTNTSDKRSHHFEEQTTEGERMSKALDNGKPSSKDQHLKQGK